MHLLKILAGLAVLSVPGVGAPPLAAQGVKPAGLNVYRPWTRQTAPGQANGGGFLTIVNPGGRADRLLGVSSPIAARAEIHSMSMQGGVMRMRPVTGGLAIPAGGRVELKPGGYHIMLIGLKGPLKLGAQVPLTLRFQHAGVITVRLKVEPVTHGMAVEHDHG